MKQIRFFSTILLIFSFSAYGMTITQPGTINFSKPNYNCPQINLNCNYTHWFTEEPTVVPGGRTVIGKIWNSRAQQGNNSNLAFSWSMGDGNHKSGRQIAYHYQTYGQKHVTLSINQTNVPNNQCSLTKQVSIPYPIVYDPQDWGNDDIVQIEHWDYDGYFQEVWVYTAVDMEYLSDYKIYRKSGSSWKLLEERSVGCDTDPSAVTCYNFYPKHWTIKVVVTDVLGNEFAEQANLSY